MQKRGLGRGLESLIPGLSSSSAPLIIDNFGVGVEEGTRFEMIPTSKIIPSQNQPRKFFDPIALRELALSIQEHGLVQPVVVRPIGDEYELVVGERRWRAAVDAGLDSIPAVIRNTTEVESIELALIENLQRQDLNPIEEATAYYHLMVDFNLTQEEIARKVGKKRSSIANTVRLLKLPEKIKEMMIKGEVSKGHGKSLLMLRDEEKQMKLANEIIKKNLNVRQSEHLATLWQEKENNLLRTTRAQVPTHYKLLVKNISKKLNTSVNLRMIDKERGKIEVRFENQEELKRIVYELFGEDFNKENVFPEELLKD